jgi:hypothetical protein
MIYSKIEVVFLDNILKENNVPDTQKYSLHCEWLAGQKLSNSRTYQETILVIPTASDLADSLNLMSML